METPRWKVKVYVSDVRTNNRTSRDSVCVRILDRIISFVSYFIKCYHSYRLPSISKQFYFNLLSSWQL